MSMTLDLNPGLEANLRQEATRAGVDATTLILRTLERQFGNVSHPDREAALMLKINEGAPEKVWQRYHELARKRDAETLTGTEHAELLTLSKAIEEIDVQRLALIAELAQLRGSTLGETCRQFGLPKASDIG